MGMLKFQNEIDRIIEKLTEKKELIYIYIFLRNLMVQLNMEE